jgi:NADH dehydrogenase
MRTRQVGDSVITVDRDGQLALVDAARDAGVRHFVHVSYSGNFDDNSPLTLAKRAVEERLKASGMTYTILRPSVFMEVWLTAAHGFDLAGGNVRIFGTGDQPVSYISLGDVAQFAVEALRNPAARNATIELGGPEAVSPNDVVRLGEEIGGRPVRVERVPEEALEAQLAAATDPLAQSFAAIMLNYDRGDVIDMSETLRTFPVEMTSVRRYVERVLRA